ncbi:hydroxymethylpyrimidine transport system permease protein [Staphylococcus aureus]|uniref:Hydroxymethylpyrimidine transport system permease protein n=1 Tax=Staphylococcus aureus TaxID=1280 RepID=A0A380E1M4_STAAU|nr:hydroxymethylpyrimidine transport system permease protein [Staphylococcus aureus]
MQHLKVKSKVAYAFMAAIRMIPLMISSLIQLRRSLKMRYQMIDAANYRGLQRFKHLIIPLLSQTLERLINYQLRWNRKDLEMVLVLTITTYLSHIKM